MRGEPDSCGIWAPCLTHADGRFWLIYTDVKRYGRASAGVSGASLRDVHNYLVTCETIDGEWSDPIALNSSGFDPSLFHDDDGRKYLVNMLWDHRPNRHHFGGIVLQVLFRIFVPSSVPSGFTTVITIILFVGGIQLLCLSIIGSYLAHIYEEVKRRPAFIVESILNPPQGGQPTQDSPPDHRAPRMIR